MKVLRPHQTIVYDKIKALIQKGNKKLLVSAPTGYGKTILSYEIIKNALAKKNNVLFTCHRIQLAEQSVKVFSDLNPELLQGTNKLSEGENPFIVATLQTLLTTEISVHPKIILIDECHFGYESKLIQSLFDRFPDSIFIGLSATPVDDRGYLLEGFDCIIDDFQTEDLIKLGYLTPFEIFTPISPDLSKVSVTQSGDYNQTELESTVNKIDYNQSIVNEYLRIGEMRPFICFAVNKAHCAELEKLFLNSLIAVRTISADTKEKDRQLYLKQIKTGELLGLISIEILTAGFDEPKISCVILANPTKAWKKYIQCCGRGIRLIGNTIEESIKNGKKNCILIDCANNIEEHDTPHKRYEFKFKKKISRVIDRELGLEDLEVRKEVANVITVEKQLFLKRIGSLLDIYDGKVYKIEAELQEDVNNFLDKTNYFWWRQNSGKMFKDGRWIHFASKSGLPDNTVFYNKTSFFFGVELKMPSGRLTDHQKRTLPEMNDNNVLFFICESVYDVYKSIEHVELNVQIDDSGFKVLNTIFDLPEKQIGLRNKLKLPLPKVK